MASHIAIDTALADLPQTPDSSSTSRNEGYFSNSPPSTPTRSSTPSSSRAVSPGENSSVPPNIDPAARVTIDIAVPAGGSATESADIHAAVEDRSGADSSDGASEKSQDSDGVSVKSQDISGLIRKPSAEASQGDAPEIPTMAANTPEETSSTEPRSGQGPSSDSPNPNVEEIPNEDESATGIEVETQPDESDLVDPHPIKRFAIKKSRAKAEWERQKAKGESNEAIDDLMKLVGLEEVKQVALDFLSQVNISKRQGLDVQKLRLNTVFQGNPGTGKTTVARIYARILHSIGAIESDEVIETSGARLAHNGVKDIERRLEFLMEGGGGVLFVDEAYQLTAPHSSGSGRQVLDVLLTEMENNIGKLVIVFAGYVDDMQSFFEHNQGLPSRVPYTWIFSDFDDSELSEIFRGIVEKRYNRRMKIQGGIDGLYVRVAIRRLAAARDFRGFGNARAVENFVSVVAKRQSRRIVREQHDGLNPSCLYFTKEDLIGRKPADVMESNGAWKDLQALIGLEDVKSTARYMFDMLATNYARELEEYRPLQLCLNRIFLGNPGTGKTTVARLYGEIMADIGLLSNGEVVIKNPSDFIGECLGKSEAKTRAILKATLGKVLIIDESYGLHSDNDQSQQDTYKKAVLDTLVAEVQGVAGDDRCILLLGYEDKVRDMFQASNPGLSRRFGIDKPFLFKDYNLEELERILELKLKQQEMCMQPAALPVVLSILDRARRRPNFSNAGEIDACLDHAKINYQARQSLKPLEERAFDTVLEPVDFDPKHDQRNGDDFRNSLKGVVSEAIIQKLERFHKIAQGARNIGQDPRRSVPSRFVFKGPPGTGKTTAARSMGKVFYDIGFLSTDEVIECSASDLIGQCVGHTVPKTRKMFNRALGKVLLIDEAARLAKGDFAREAIEEMTHLLTNKDYGDRMIVILAGYEHHMEYLLRAAPGLIGLFSTEIVFKKLTPEESITLLIRELEDRQASIPCLDNTDSMEYKQLFPLVKALTLLPTWNNARDVKTLAANMAAKALEVLEYSPVPTTSPTWSPTMSLTASLTASPNNFSAPSNNLKKLAITAAQAMRCLKDLFHTHRTLCYEDKQLAQYNNIQITEPAEPVEQVMSHSESAQKSTGLRQTNSMASIAAAIALVRRRTSVSSARPGIIRRMSQAYGNVGGLDETAEICLRPPDAGIVSDLRTDEEEDEDLERRRLQRLQQIGDCPEGFAWHQEANGWRCDGGQHFVSDEQLGNF